MIKKIKNIPFVLFFRKKIYQRKFSGGTNISYFSGVFETFEFANISAPKTKPISYDNLASAKMYKERTRNIYSTDYPALFWMEKIKSKITSVFDFGGHIGIHFYSYSTVLDFSTILKWTVCDVESVCEEGKNYAKTKDIDQKLGFVSDIKNCEGYDLFYAKGSLQYLEWELHEQLIKLSDRPKYLIINTTPMHSAIKTITINNIGTAFCPYHIRKESDFFDGLKSLGYEVIDVWSNEEKSCNIAFEPERSVSYYRGAFLKLKES